MLAKEYEPKKHNVVGWYCSEKYDGVRGFWKASEKKMYSRGGKVYTLPKFIQEQLSKVKIDLDGEIWFGHDTFDICSGAARKDACDSKVWENVKYMVFDTPDLDLEYEDRQILINTELKDLKNVDIVKYFIVTKDTDLMKELKKIEDNKGEGLMLRKPKSMYEMKKSNCLLKVKSWKFDEAEVIGYDPGDGRLEGMVGSLVLKHETFGSFKVGTGLVDEIRKELDNEKRVENKKKNANIPVFGDKITFRYKELTKNNIPKMPSYIGIRDYE
jgi:DNA ligase-1